MIIRRRFRCSVAIVAFAAMAAASAHADFRWNGGGRMDTQDSLVTHRANTLEPIAGLTPEQRLQIRQQMREHWQQVTPEQRDALRQRWQNSTPDERRQWRQERLQRYYDVGPAPQRGPAQGYRGWR